ncbi:hypothetical protein BB558_000049 [Smittium angustum]|uniref:Superoxide dismutase 1 copper chaperone n=1 Tax=Smittium angustum TaxID=133377 RepID=A0A2U1JFU0_SMIAN|nr:hypothetical protein BB558_000049 [Smittium angustum]
MEDPIKMEYAVEMTCEGCIKDIKKTLSDIKGIQSISADLDNKTIVVEGTAQPSLIVDKLYSSGRTAIIRGTGLVDSNTPGAAVCILENYSKNDNKPIGITSGLVRFVQIRKNTCYLDISFNGEEKGYYGLSVHEFGALNNVPESCGRLYSSTTEAISSENAKYYNDEIIIQTDSNGQGKKWMECKGWVISDLIGRSVILRKLNEKLTEEKPTSVLAGIIARSAGLFQNSKVVCACSGRTLWEEDKEIPI